MWNLTKRTLIFLICLAPAGAAAAAEMLLDGRGGALWIPDEGTARIELSDGTRAEPRLALDVDWNSLSAEPGRWLVAGTQGNERLVLAEGGSGAQRDLAPPRHAGPLVRGPVLVADGLGGSGLVWLEGKGPRSLAVRYAPRRSDGWGPTHLVSPPGAGSQLAVAATALDDGRILLLWSAFDGQDDEILWSLGGDSGWSPPRRLAPQNEVPDITPAVVATPDGGALAAWSRYDGREYRLALARFDGRSWSPPRSLTTSGDLFPSFTSLDGHFLLQALHATTDRWSWVELSPQGELRARTEGFSERSAAIGISEQGLELRASPAADSQRLPWNR